MNDKARLLRSLSIERSENVDIPHHGKPWGRTLLGVVACLATLGVLVAFWIGAPSVLGTKAPEPAVIAVAPAKVEPTRQQVPVIDARQSPGLIASGYVVARRKATVASEVTGKVVDLLVEEGVAVKAGDVLARLDNTLAEKDYALATSRVEGFGAAIDAIAADLRDAERIQSRTETLSQKSYATQADLTKSQARVGVLQGQLRQAEAQLVTARLDAQRSQAVLDKHQIRAPFNGIVVDRSAQPGEMISPLSAGSGFTRTGICTIVDMDSIEVEVDVNEASITRVHVGTRVNASLDAYPGWTIPGIVIAIVPTANREKATVKVRIALTVKDARILPDLAIKTTFIDDGDASRTSESRTRQD